MRSVTISTDGINWIHYATYNLDEEAMTATRTSSWRAHKFEDRGEHVDCAAGILVDSKPFNLKAAFEEGGFDFAKKALHAHIPTRVLLTEGKRYLLLDEA